MAFPRSELPKRSVTHTFPCYANPGIAPTVKTRTTAMSAVVSLVFIAREMGILLTWPPLP
jgi:hypothetical protein